MTSKPTPPLDANARAQMKQWLENWKELGPILEEERWSRVRALTDDEAWNEAQGLCALWEPSWIGDAGEGLLLQQAVFARARERRSR